MAPPARGAAASRMPQGVRGVCVSARKMHFPDRMKHIRTGWIAVLLAAAAAAQEGLRIPASAPPAAFSQRRADSSSLALPQAPDGAPFRKTSLPPADPVPQSDAGFSSREKSPQSDAAFSAGQERPSTPTFPYDPSFPYDPAFSPAPTFPPRPERPPRVVWRPPLAAPVLPSVRRRDGLPARIYVINNISLQIGGYVNLTNGQAWIWSPYPNGYLDARTLSMPLPR